MGGMPPPWLSQLPGHEQLQGYPRTCRQHPEAVHLSPMQGAPLEGRACFLTCGLGHLQPKCLKSDTTRYYLNDLPEGSQLLPDIRGPPQQNRPVPCGR